MPSSLRSFKEKLTLSIEGDVQFDLGTLAVYSHDASNYRRVPIGVVKPRHDGDVTAALALARENQVPLVARGGGTSLAGQAINTALVLDFSKYMNRVLAIDATRRVVTVEPGVVQSSLNAALSSHKLFFAPDPATKDRCTIGGMLGNNSCGAHSAAYGKTVDNVESLDVRLYDGTQIEAGPTPAAQFNAVLARGGPVAALYRRLGEFRDRWADTVWRGFPRLPRRVSGYNLDELLPENDFNIARALTGSEGTLAITLAAALRVVPRPNNLAMAVLGFKDVFSAADQVAWMLAHRPEALEGFDHNLPDLARKKKFEGVNLLPEGSAFLLVELAGETGDEARERAEKLLGAARRSGHCLGAALLQDGQSQKLVWGIRESGLGAGAYIPGYPRTWPGAEDTAVPPARLGSYLRRFAEVLARHELRTSTYYGHFGEGCLHARINFDLASARGIATFRAAMEEIAALVAEFGGSLSGEHGDGIARSELLGAIFGPRLIDAFREFKHIFDPGLMLNPGVLAYPHPIDSHLKLGPSYKAPAIATHFDLSADGGFAGAVLKCVGIGKCRKTDAGTMCPSYMATGEEKHSTRGRARILFEALRGELLPGGLTDEAVAQALDLCLSCKACKTECPAAVDMAAYKSEFVARYYQQHRRPLGAHFFAGIHELSRLASVMPSLANALSAAPIAAGIIRRFLDIHSARALARFAPRTFRSWFTRRPGARSGGREVLLFPDTFTNYFEPEVGAAAVAVLERAGFRVVIPPRDLCCGRPLYEQGMVARAKERLGEVVATLTPFIERGMTVVGLEPSCLLTFRDELPGLFAGESRACALGKRALLLDEFLARQGAELGDPELPVHALLHGHCHQKALAGLAWESTILSRVRGLDLKILDAGCCGMAGAFGYGRDHFAVSRAIGERVLFPAVGQSPPDTIVIADGFSCRSQIRQFCPSRRVMHLAQVLNLGSTPAND